MVMRQKHGAEHTAHNAETVKAVAALLARHVGAGNAATWDQLAQESGVRQRQLRKVATTLDGSRWLLGYVDPEEAGAGEPHGIFLCRNAAEAESLTRQLIAKATDEMARAKRRTDYAMAMTLWPPVQQLDLWGIAS